MDDELKARQTSEAIYISSDEEQEQSLDEEMPDTPSETEQCDIEEKKRKYDDVMGEEEGIGPSLSGTYRRIHLKYQSKQKCFRLVSNSYEELLVKSCQKFPELFPGRMNISNLAQFFLHRSSVTLQIQDNYDVEQLVGGDSIELVLKTIENANIIPSSLVRWFWWDDDNKWKVYSKESSSELEQAFVCGEKTMKIEKDYVVDFTARTQTRVLTSKTRKIIRGSWFWKADSGFLVPYDEKVATQLEQAYTVIQGTTGQKKLCK